MYSFIYIILDKDIQGNTFIQINIYINTPINIDIDIYIYIYIFVNNNIRVYIYTIIIINDYISIFIYTNIFIYIYNKSFINYIFYLNYILITYNDFVLNEEVDYMLTISMVWNQVEDSVLNYIKEVIISSVI